MHKHHDHVGCHCHDHDHDHEHCHGHSHDHNHDCAGHCHSCSCDHSATEELTALMKYMTGHNEAHAQELVALAGQLEKAGNHMAYEQVMAAVSDFEKGNMRLRVVLASLEG